MNAVTGRDFFDLVKAIGESKSKQEEDRIITVEVMNLDISFDLTIQHVSIRSSFFKHALSVL